MATREREKALKRREEKDKRPRAMARYVRISASKVKIVIDLIRGKSIDEARAILMHTPKAASEPVMKVLNSAVANAENNLELAKDNLYIAEIYACLLYTSYYPLHTDEETAYFQQLADRYGLFVTQGSDYHGASRKSTHIGAETRGGVRVEESLRYIFR